MKQKLVIGIDFGSDSVRALVIDAISGVELGSGVCYYPRWSERKYCNPVQNQYRQHALDYTESLTKAVKIALSQSGTNTGKYVVGISVDTTGSTPVAVDKNGTPLCLLPEFTENPNAMFILWKDHTAIKEADKINELAHSGKFVDYTRFVGGIYSSEWFWAKIAHIQSVDSKVAEAAFSWVEHCDWISAELAGETNPLTLKRSRCAAGHKALWHANFNGLPDETFLEAIHPSLRGLKNRLFTNTYTSDQVMGKISKKWAEILNINEDAVIGVGAFDAHFGAVGGGCEPYIFTRIMGTSTCDILTIPNNEFGEKIIKGICGQVDGSVIPGMMGLEAGQSAFGDVYAWYSNSIIESVKPIIQQMSEISSEIKENLIKELTSKLITNLSDEASKLPLEQPELALDWHNGRRTPYANQNLKSAICGISLGTQSSTLFKALVESTAFGSKAIIDCFENQHIRIDGVVALGGVAQKSSFVMQTLANVIQKNIKVAKSDQTCALGASMFAATAARVYPNVLEAQKAMNQGFIKEYSPNKQTVEYFNKKYKAYQELGNFVLHKS
jgi:L-ribulokinase